jgi:surface protein
VIYAAEGETVGFTTDIGETALAASDGALSQNGAAFTLTMPAANVSVCRHTDMKYEIHYTENVTGGIVYPSRVRTYAGDLVRIYRDPAAGYVPDTVTVVDSQNAPVAVQADENGVPCFIMPADEVYLSAAFKLKYSYNAGTGELRLLCGEFGSTQNSRWAAGDAAIFVNVTSVTAEPGVRFTGGMENLFISFIRCTSFDLHNVDVSGVTSVRWMFSGCRSMTSLNISGWDLSQVADAHEMFAGCSSLGSFSLSDLAGAPLADIGGMFSGCSSLASVDLSALDPAALPDMTGIFSGCPSLCSVTLARGMSVAEDMELNNNGMGWVVEGTSVILCGGDALGTFTAPSAVTTFKWATEEFGPTYLFDETTGALTLRWGEFCGADDVWAQIRSHSASITSVTAQSGVSLTGNCDRMFSLFTACLSIDLSGADFSGVTGMAEMFAYCDALTSLDLSGRNASGVDDLTSLFEGCSSLASLDLSGFTTAAGARIDNTFLDCSSLTSVTIPAGVTDRKSVV